MPSIDVADSDKADKTSNHHAPRAEGSSVKTESHTVELDEFGLPIRRHTPFTPVEEGREDKHLIANAESKTDGKDANSHVAVEDAESTKPTTPPLQSVPDGGDVAGDNEFKDAKSTPNEPEGQMKAPAQPSTSDQKKGERAQSETDRHTEIPQPQESVRETESRQDEDQEELLKPAEAVPAAAVSAASDAKDGINKDREATKNNGHSRMMSSASQGISEWSHQHLTQPEAEQAQPEEDEWQPMPAFAPYDMYDDNNKLIAREAHESDEEDDPYAGLGGAGKGYTRVQLDEDVQSATSLDENTQYLFREANDTGAGIEEEEQRDAVSQMQATKELLTEGQRIAYVGMTRLILSTMLIEAIKLAAMKGSKREVQMAAEAMQMWSQKMMVRLYAHMDISAAEQIMIEQLVEHGVQPSDMTPTLMQNARVKNPMASSTAGSSSRPGSVASSDMSHRPSTSAPPTPRPDEEEAAAVPPPYQEHEGDDLPEVRMPSQLPKTTNIDIDLRWTVLCDLFLTLIADSVYDARSRVLLERVGENMGVSWLEICRFEKRVTDAVEMQQSAQKENWNEDVHKENRRKMALKKRYVMMGLATVGGSLVIGLSAGLLAPVIGAGLAAGFTTIGVAGTSGFLAGAGGAALITSSAAASGGVIAVRAANRRTGAVKTFEYRPLHNNKRVNLIITVSGWMTGKVDDVRLPYSTVDPIMGDLYSVLWEPEMLRSMGDTINILATEALTQGLQQVLGSTILIGLMAALQLPVVLTKLAYLIDNPWTVSLDRANSAGLILADSLIDRNLGTRPITFVGYSLGSRVIFSCLTELARKGAFGLVQNVYLFGSPIVAKREEYLRARSVVAGRFVNGYAKNDWILGYLFRLTSGGISRVAGLAPVEGIPGFENVDVTDIVPGHMAYRAMMPRLLREVGWLVESDEFTEIEDPDPENHQQRQRELINEIEEARKEFERKERESKGKFGFFGRKKKAVVERKEWETYQEYKGDANPKGKSSGQGSNDGVLFDIDAIRAELASEQMEVKELQSTLPPMKLDLSSESTNPRSSLRETKSSDAATTLNTNDYKSSPAASSPGQSSSTRMQNGYLQEDMDRGFGGDEEEEIQMTFDTSYETPPRSASASFYNPPPSSAISPHPPPLADPVDRAATLQRPELKSSATLPTTMPSSLDHNAWADEEEDFGHEREIEMTFA